MPDATKVTTRMNFVLDAVERPEPFGPRDVTREALLKRYPWLGPRQPSWTQLPTVHVRHGAVAAMGFSGGSALAAHLAVQHPALVPAVCLFSGGHHWTPGGACCGAEKECCRAGGACCAEACACVAAGEAAGRERNVSRRLGEAAGRNDSCRYEAPREAPHWCRTSNDDLHALWRSRAYYHRPFSGALPAEARVPHGPDCPLSLFAAWHAKVLMATTNSSHAIPLRARGPPPSPPPPPHVPSYQATGCGEGRSFFEDCGYDGPGACVRHAFALDAAAEPAAAPCASCLRAFDQRPWWDDRAAAAAGAPMSRDGLARRGALYVPAACHATGIATGAAGAALPEAGARGGCGLLVLLHGCGMWESFAPMLALLGLQEWAESQRLVLLVPQLLPHGSTKTSLEGCFETASREQVEAVRGMIHALLGGSTA